MPKKLSDKRIKELRDLYCNKSSEMYMAIQELLEYRKTQPKFTVGQKVWFIWYSLIYQKWVVYKKRMVVCRFCFDGNYWIYFLEYRDFANEINLFATKHEAEAECDRRNGEKK